MEKMRYKMEELIPIVAELTGRYTSYESTSISYEKANQFMEAVIYCIHEYEVSILNNEYISGSDTSAGNDSTASNTELTERSSDKNITAKEAYTRGCRLVDEKVRAMKEEYHLLIHDFHSYGNIALQDTVTAIPEFLKWYDSRFAPQDTILLMDYPLLKNLSGYTGIDAVYEYVKCIRTEQRFLQRFPDMYVIDVLSAYSAEYEELFENICGIVLSDVIRHILLKKAFDGSGITENERERIGNIVGEYSAEQLKELICRMMVNFIREFYEEDMEIWRYIETECGQIAVRLKYASAGTCN